MDRYRFLRRVRYYLIGTRGSRRRTLSAAMYVGIVLFIFYITFFAAPFSFPAPTLVKIPRGMTVSSAAELLKEKHIIHSTFLFEATARIFGGDSQLIAGEYYFASPQGVVRVALRLAEGDYELVPVKVSIGEGATSKDIAALLNSKIPDFDSKTFLKLAQPKEGRLYPDTYFFLPGEDPDLVLTAFENNFNQRIYTPQVSLAIELFGKPFPDVLTMASLLQKEASDMQDQRIIAGILWKRLSLGMPLQVDASFSYFLNKSSAQLTSADLRKDSPYNTYINKGLPPGPIANPGVDAILAAVKPIKTNYLYYLSDSKGNFHYASTYAQHLANKAKYIGS